MQSALPVLEDRQAQKAMPLLMVNLPGNTPGCKGGMCVCVCAGVGVGQGMSSAHDLMYRILKMLHEVVVP